MVSNGSLPYGYTLDDILVGLSICRNSRLAQIFYRLNLIEAYGTGLARIVSSYSNSENKPAFMATPNAFKVVLPKIKAGGAKSDKKEEFTYGSLDSAEEKAYMFLKENGLSPRQRLEEAIGGSAATAVRTLKRLKDKGLVKTEGSGKNIRYCLWD